MNRIPMLLKLNFYFVLDDAFEVIGNTTILLFKNL